MSWPTKGDETVEPKPFWPTGVAEETVKKKTPEKRDTDLDELDEIYRQTTDPNFDTGDYFP